MSRLGRWSFKSPQQNSETTLPPQSLSSAQPKDIASPTLWETPEPNEFPVKPKEVERLWGFENFGNTCYCNSVLQSLYFCAPFREFVESYPDILPPQIPLGPPPDKMITTPLSPGSGFNGSNSRPSSPLTAVKSNPFDVPTTSNGVPILAVSPTNEKSQGKEKRSWTGLGRRPTTSGSSASALPSVPQGQVTQATLDPPANDQSTAAVEPELDPNNAPPTVFATIQTLFSHMNTSPPHQPLPTKKPTDQTNANVSVAALATANGNTLPAASLTTTSGPTSPGQTNGNVPQPPPLLASLPPPSAPRGGGPFQAGTLGRGVIRPEDLLRTVKRENEMFRGMSQQDAHEFLGWMLNRIAEEVEQLDKEKKQKNGVNEKMGGNGKTFVQNLFEGTLTNETRCLSCETTSSRDEAFLDLSIDIEQHTSVTACLRQFSASEMLCQKNKFFCETCCGLQEAEKRMKIKRLPNVLALHLKRFKYQENLGRYVKLSYRVPFPTQLRLPNTSDDAEDPDRLYELFAVVVHIGNGPHHGHYVAIVRSAGRWVMCDDENIEPIEESDIPRYFGDYPSGAGYVLFYQAADLDLAGLGLKTPPPPPAPVTIMDLADLSVSDPAPMPVPTPLPMATPARSDANISSSQGTESTPAESEEMEDPFADTPSKPDPHGRNGFYTTPPTNTAEGQFIQPRAFRSPSRSTTDDRQSLAAPLPLAVTAANAPSPVAARSDLTSPTLGKDNGGNWFKRGKDKKAGALPGVSRADSGETVTAPAERAPMRRQATATTMNTVSSGSTTFGGLGLTVNSAIAGDGAGGVMAVISPSPNHNGSRQPIPDFQMRPTPPTEASPAAMSSSVISSFSASSGTPSQSGTGSSVPATPQGQINSSSLAPPISGPPSSSSQGLTGLGRKESKRERVPSAASGTSSTGGGSLGRRLSGITRSGSMAFKMGFGKKDKDKDRD